MKYVVRAENVVFLSALTISYLVKGAEINNAVPQFGAGLKGAVLR
jgi:hypothetical protein